MHLDWLPVTGSHCPTWYASKHVHHFRLQRLHVVLPHGKLQCTSCSQSSKNWRTRGLQRCWYAAKIKTVCPRWKSDNVICVFLMHRNLFVLQFNALYTLTEDISWVGCPSIPPWMVWASRSQCVFSLCWVHSYWYSGLSRCDQDHALLSAFGVDIFCLHLCYWPHTTSCFSSYFTAACLVPPLSCIMISVIATLCYKWKYKQDVICEKKT